ncbi:MAG TPA: hypothetical protein VHL31_11450 [Geminicoccus sp.]|uniref:hypothetical protein n=1 Tax=Geminicoccus sp. TaxID=2024832 RepID=UPI002E3524DC|nr:hypothetical protein [Geminicoccus sp.]HEX2526894.1 hypothetical protein [Geminicoccus sp.]
MDPLPSLPAILVERQAIHPATAALLSSWQRRAEQDACPETCALLAAIVGCLRELPKAPHTANVTAVHVIDDLISDIREQVISDLRPQLSRLRLQVYAERLGKLAAPSAAEA